MNGLYNKWIFNRAKYIFADYDTQPSYNNGLFKKILVYNENYTIIIRNKKCRTRTLKIYFF